MIQDGLLLPDFAQGEVRPSRILPESDTSVLDLVGGKDVIRKLPGLWLSKGRWEHNDVLYDAATIFAELLRGAPDGKSYQINAMYIEYENNGGAVVSPPSFGRDGGKTYYDGLSIHATRDYIRVPLTAATMDSTDEANYARGNRLTNFGQTEGVTGVHGKAFNDTQQSRVFGGALVATPEFSDQTQDLVLSRFYFADSANQLIKLAGSQIGLTWRFKLL
jgi:hypothetical protein